MFPLARCPLAPPADVRCYIVHRPDGRRLGWTTATERAAALAARSGGTVTEQPGEQIPVPWDASWEICLEGCS